jgi:histidinol-phosphatase (PHP family)
MQKFNYHTHTARCGHASGDDEQYVKAAIAAGYETLGFSDHAPFPGVVHPGDRMRMDELNTYIASVTDLKRDYAGIIDIKLGLEFEYFPEMEYYYRHLRTITDYLIVGQHNRMLDRMEYNHWADDDDVLYCAGQIIAAVENGFADIIAHPDCFMLGRRSWSAACEEAARKICDVSIRYNVPLELNTNGMRFGKQHYDIGYFYPYPFRPFWEIIAETQAPVIFGVDAHRPMVLTESERFDKCLDELAGLTFNFQHDYHI